MDGLLQAFWRRGLHRQADRAQRLVLVAGITVVPLYLVKSSRVPRRTEGSRQLTGPAVGRPN